LPDRENGETGLERDNEFELGQTGLIGNPAARKALDGADLLLMVGTDFPYSDWYPTGKVVVQIDERGENIGRRTTVEHGVVGDAKLALKELLELVASNEDRGHLESSRKTYTDWRERQLGLADPGHDERAAGRARAVLDNPENRIRPEAVAAAIDRHAAADAIFTSDTGMATVWLSRFVTMSGTRRLIGSYNLGSMANAMPHALGAQALDRSIVPEPNAMAIALAEAAVAQGLEIVLLPAAYGRGGPGRKPSPEQLRFCDPDVAAFLERLEGLRDWARNRESVHVGVAVHSVRAAPADWIEAIAEYAERHDLIRHVHACEQRRELQECDAEHGCSPIELLERCGFLSERTSVVHGIHVSDRDVELLAESGTIVVTCPTTEGNLGDGHLPALRYRDAGVRLAIGTDQQVRIDPFEELREMETQARREGQTRDAMLAAADGDLWGKTVANGRASLGLDGAPGGIEIDLDHPEIANVAGADLKLALTTSASAAVVASPHPG